MMKFSRIPASLLLAVLFATVAFGTPSAEAQGLFDLLFGGGRVRERAYLPQSPRQAPRQEWRRRQYQSPPKRQQRRVAIPKITGPSYYDYKADPLVRTDFGALAALRRTGFEPMLTGAAFREAAVGLEGFDLGTETEIAKALADYY